MAYGTELKLPDCLLRYSATASLLTAGLLATSSQPSVAGTIITNVYDPSVGDLVAGESLDINMDGAGAKELTLFVRSADIAASAASGIAVLGTGNSHVVQPYVLSVGAPITYSQAWASIAAGGSILLSAGGWMGKWILEDGTEKHYMGIAFPSGIDFDVRYGWIEMTVTSTNFGAPHVIVHRTGMDSPAGDGLPASVELASAQGASGLQTAAASAFAALGGALTWIRRKLGA